MLIILPTDTCYGLAWELTEQDYLEIYRLKWRDFTKQLALLVEDFDDMKKYIEISDEQIELSKNYPYPWSFLGKRNDEFQLPAWMNAEQYQMISLRVARACLKNLYPPLIRGDVPKIEGLSGCEIPSDNSPEIPSESPPDKGGRGVSFIPYNRELTKKAQENRKSMNAPERKMWYDILHAEKIRSHKFLRQKPLGEYIVDFYCQELWIVIEIDGESHLGQIEYDQKRTLFLESYGLNVLRFTKKEVMENTEWVYLHICDYIASQKLTPQPPLSGGQIPYSYANPPTPLIRGADTISTLPHFCELRWNARIKNSRRSERDFSRSGVNWWRYLWSSTFRYFLDRGRWGIAVCEEELCTVRIN